MGSESLVAGNQSDDGCERITDGALVRRFVGHMHTHEMSVRVQAHHWLRLTRAASATEWAAGGLVFWDMSLDGQEGGCEASARTPGPREGGRDWSTWQHDAFARLPTFQLLPFLLGNAPWRPGSSRIPS